jgi:hypothetical protein
LQQYGGLGGQPRLGDFQPTGLAPPQSWRKLWKRGPSPEQVARACRAATGGPRGRWFASLRLCSCRPDVPARRTAASRHIPAKHESVLMEGVVVSIELRILVWSIVLGLVQVLLQAHSASLQVGYRWTAVAREARAPLTGIAGRLERALRNFLETFPLFAAAVHAVEDRLVPLPLLQDLRQPAAQPGRSGRCRTGQPPASLHSGLTVKLSGRPEVDPVPTTSSTPCAGGTALSGKRS